MPEKDAPIQLIAYDQKWPILFEEERGLLVHVLAPWLVGPIEHIGSTAVPGLEAKPVIDMMAAVASLEKSKGAIEAVRSLGYLYAPYRADQIHWFCKPHPSFRTHHLHLVPYCSALWSAQIAFRDRLRHDRHAAANYTELKRSLARRFPTDREAYTDGKSHFVSQILDEELKKS